MTVPTETESHRTASEQGDYPRVPASTQPVRPIRRRERPIRRHATAGASRRVAPSACMMRPAARPVRFLLLLGVATAVTVVLLGLLAAAGREAASVPESTTVTQVRAGETLWEVAQRSVPEGDTSAVLDRIQQLNELPPAAVLRSGQPVRVPITGS